MSTQSTLKDFFKVKLNQQNNMDNRKKKLSLSLKKTPTKSPKLCNDKNVSIVINLDSDEENYLSEPYGETASQAMESPDITMSDASDSTLIYSLETPKKNTKKSNYETPNQLLQFPVEIKRPLTPVSDIDTLNSSPISQQSNTEEIVHRTSTTPTKTSTPKQKFYSPTKKRCVTLRTPSKARKNILSTLDDTRNYEGFIQNGEGLDDKTTFMLDIIKEFLKDKSLNHLLNKSSCNLLREIVSATNDGLKLLCNLYGRKQRWYRWEEIKTVLSKKKSENVDDANCHTILNSLIQKGIIVASNYQGSVQNNFCFDELVGLLKKDEILTVCKLYKLKPSGKKDGVRLLENYSKQKTNISAYFSASPLSSNENRVMRSLAEKLGACFKLSEEILRTLEELYVLMYLGMDYNIIKEKKLEYTLILDKSNRQTFPYKNVKTDNASVVFDTREEFERYLSAMSIYDKYMSETDNTESKLCLVRRVFDTYKDISDEEMRSYCSKLPWLYKFTPPNIYIKILEDGIRFLKQDRSGASIPLALEILSALTAQTAFRQHRRPEWYAEKALIVNKFQSKPEEAASILLEGLKLDIREEAKDVVKKRAGILARRQRGGISAGARTALLAHLEGEEGLERGFKAVHVYKCPMESNGGKIRFQTRTESGLEVQDAEGFCLSHYIQSGRYTHGEHWEGRIVTTIFFLLFWEEIYSPDVPGTALCRFQEYPLDMWGDEFQRNRPGLIEKLARVELGKMDDVVEQMRRVWNERPEGELSGINRSVGWEAAEAVSRCLGPKRLAAICRRLATHYGYSHSGFPDLTLWNVRTSEIAFVEVKTDSDRPSAKQLQWMSYLRHHGVCAEFCYVGVNTRRCRARGGEE